jgi:ABC-type antimicrobial peptide transport system permease subunit
MSLVIRSTSDPAALAQALRAEVRGLDPNLPMSGLRTMLGIVSASVAQRRFQMSLILVFALVALALTLVGIYGVVSYAIVRRAGEIGLRMALGAQPGDVLRLMLAQGLAPVLIGLIAGAAGAALTARTLRSFLFGIGPLDPAAMGAVGSILLFTAMAACYLPARRAAAMDPLAALREE